jgi:hypothetical protein
LKKVKIFTIFIGLAMAVYAVVKYANVDWWYETLKKPFVPSKSEVVEIYTYKDKSGTTIITDKPIPEEYRYESNKIGTYKKESSK